MNAENFIMFTRGFENYKLQKAMNSKEVLDIYAISKFNDNGQAFIRGIEEGLKNVKIIEINDKQKKFLIEKKLPKRLRKFSLKSPYEDIFLDISFTQEYLAKYNVKIQKEMIIGVLVQNKIIAMQSDNTMKNIEAEGFRITIFTKKNDEALFETYNKNLKLSNEFKHYKIKNNPTTDKQSREFIWKFIINLLDFVNYPQVILKEHQRSEANIQRRIKQGKQVIPSVITVQLTGELERYIDNIDRQEPIRWHYHYKFDVKGHPRQLTSPRYKQAREIWVNSYEKGEGIKVPNKYVIKAKGV